MRQEILESIYRRREQIKESLLNEAEDEGVVASGRQFGGSRPFADLTFEDLFPFLVPKYPQSPYPSPSGRPLTMDEITYGVNTYSPGRKNPTMPGAPGSTPSGPAIRPGRGGGGVRGKGGRFSRDDTRTREGGGGRGRNR